MFKATSIAIHSVAPGAKVIADPAITSWLSGDQLAAMVLPPAPGKKAPVLSADTKQKIDALRAALPYVDGIVNHFYPYQYGANTMGGVHPKVEIARLADIKNMYAALTYMKGAGQPPFVGPVFKLQLSGSDCLKEVAGA